MNKQGQTIITVAFIVLVGFVVLLFMAPTITLWGHQAALLASTGFEAFLWDYLLLWVMLGFFLFTLVGLYVGGGGA